MKRKILIGLLLALLLLLLPLPPGQVVTLKVRYAYYACQPCSLGFAYLITQVYRPQDQALLGQDIVLYYQKSPGRGYFAEYAGHRARDFACPTQVLCSLRWRSIYNRLTHASYEADVYKWVVIN